MCDRNERTEKLIGKKALDILKNSHVAVFGIGGVGGYAAEALVRSGVEHITIIDKDVVSLSNINRQIIALTGTIGKAKTQVMKERLLDINPNLTISALQMFYLPENAHTVDLNQFDYIIDAIDNITAKTELIQRAKYSETPIISSMGTGNKLHPEMLEVCDIYSTEMCPLARIMRRELKKRNIQSLKVVYSKEQPINTYCDDKRTPASMIFVPAVAGLMLAGEVVKDIICQSSNL